MKLYALLISVSDYPPGISDLPGCREDLRAMDEFLVAYAQLNEVEYAPIKFSDAEATRSAVIDGFQHFNQAGSDDICLVYYTGHGAEVGAPEVFWDQEPSRKLQTLVLHDSRQPGGQDLVDKEISYLLATHTASAGQVLMIADSCHSGTISRLDVGTPRTAAPRAGTVRYEDLHGSETYEHQGKFRRPPVRDHITLSACLPHQVAMEMPIQGTTRGLFTYYLLEAMNSSKLSELSYTELADRVRARVKNHYGKQDIHVMATGTDDLNQLFLQGKMKRDRAYALHYRDGAGWYFTQGAIQGVAAGAGCKVLDGEAERNLHVAQVLPGEAYVETAGWLEPGKSPYPIVAVETQEVPLAVFLAPSLDKFTASDLRAAIEESGLPLQTTTDEAAAKYHVTILDDYGLSLVLPGGQRPLFKSEPSAETGWENRFVERLGKVARYEATLELAPAARPLHLPDCVEVTFEQRTFDADGNSLWVPAAQDGSAVLPYQTKDDGKTTPPRLRLSVRVKDGVPGVLHVGGLLMDESFGVTGQLLPIRELRAGDEPYVTNLSGQRKDGRQYYFPYFDVGIGEDLQAWGITEITNHFKLIVSETPFDLSGHEQEALEAQPVIDPQQTRKLLIPDDEEEEVRDRWGVKNISFTVYRPLDLNEDLRLPGSDLTPLSIANAPEGFSFTGMQLDASLSSSRSLTEDLTPVCPTEGYCLAPAGIISSRDLAADATPADTVILRNVVNPQAVTADTPLELKAEILASAGALALAYDEISGRYYPVGYPDKDRGMMVIQELPEASQSLITEKSLGGSIKLFFRKVIQEYLPIAKKELNRLRRVEIDDAFQVTYTEDDKPKITERIQQSDKPVALFIHGIIGDTTVAPGILRRAKSPDGKEFHASYGTVLTFDYENLNTPLMETAQDLQRQLKDIGLGPGHGKTVHIYCHSMGGLVSRCFIELLRGREVVQHLIQFGTPNGGSPYGKLAQLLTPLLTWGLGKAAAYNPWLSPLLGLRWFVGQVLVTLQQMKAGSDFLNNLKDDGDRGPVKYSLVNGDIHLIPDVPEADLSLLQRLSGLDNWQDGVDIIFFRQPNDIAVSVSSQRDIPAITGVTDAVGCDHLSYFDHPASVAALEGYWGEIFGN